MNLKQERTALHSISADLPRKFKLGIIIMKRLLLYFFPLKSYADRIFIIFSVVLSCVIVLGKKLSVLEKPYFQPVSPRDFIGVLVWSLIIFTIGNVLLTVIKSYLVIFQKIPYGKKWWFWAFIVLVLLWSPYLLAYYPGILSPDSFTSLLQAKDLSLLYNHIPVAYTLMVALFAGIGWAVGDANFGVFLFSLAQLFIMAGVLSYLSYWVRIRLRKKVISWIILLFYGLNPAITLYSITMWKDVLFSAWVALLCVFLTDVALEDGKRLTEKKGMVHLGILFFLVSFGRNNGIYVIILCWLILLTQYKDIRKRIFIGAGRIILVILLIQGPGYKGLGIDQSGFAESVGIPLQQISYTVTYDGPLQESECDFLEQIIPIKTIQEDYSPISADNIKFNAEFKTAFFEENKLEFMKLYVKMLPKHLSSYMQSYLLSTSGFWKIEDVGWLAADDICENDMGIYNVDYFEAFFGLDLKAGMPERINAIRTSFLTNVGIMVWFVFFYIIACFKQRQSWKAYLALPLVGCWLTIMAATPVWAQFRYVYYYHLMLPVIAVMFVAKREGDRA